MGKPAIGGGRLLVVLLQYSVTVSEASVSQQLFGVYLAAWQKEAVAYRNLTRGDAKLLWEAAREGCLRDPH